MKKPKAEINNPVLCQLAKDLGVDPSELLADSPRGLSFGQTVKERLAEEGE
ncbi:hypothetical protein [Ruegeria sp. HKCCD7318]|uniref:hypothetical protein n=1 Tax=Ruegeria sp. HKCCD7318 TaxID=2683014 RepID=UPI00147E6F12|nr:hypothetical protein [Ruegeria sp. HKCCD7318]NOE35234.1 hypothetical protein [Ruegeria sp. HKCCD7318]